MKTWQLARIGKQYSFSSAHRLPKVPEWHKCHNLHGHNYVVEVEIRGEIAPKDGFCNNVDFYDLDAKIKPLIDQLDHKYLNDIAGLENPTAENIAAWILMKLNETEAIYWGVTVWETPKCWAQVISRNGLFPKEHRD